MNPERGPLRYTGSIPVLVTRGVSRWSSSPWSLNCTSASTFASIESLSATNVSPGAYSNDLTSSFHALFPAQSPSRLTIQLSIYIDLSWSGASACRSISKPLCSMCKPSPPWQCFGDCPVVIRLCLRVWLHHLRQCNNPSLLYLNNTGKAYTSASSCMPEAVPLPKHCGVHNLHPCAGVNRVTGFSQWYKSGDLCTKPVTLLTVDQFCLENVEKW